MSKGIKIVLGLIVAGFVLMAVLAIVLVVAFGGKLKNMAQDAETRARVTKEILGDLASGEYEFVYENATSDEFKSVADADVLKEITEATLALDNMTRATVDSQSIETIDGQKVYTTKGTIYSDTATEFYEMQFVMEDYAFMMSYIGLGPDAADEN